MARFLWFVLCVFVVWGCGAPQPAQEQSVALPKPGDGPAVSETAVKNAVSVEDVKKSLDLDEYPGAKPVETSRLSSPSFSPDEARFELTRTSEDAPAKVVAFYEEKLSVKANKKGTGQEIWGQTKRGNFVQVRVDPDGKGSKFSLSVISYIK